MIERAVALAVLAASGVYLANAWPLPQGTAARPGPGFYPMAVGVFGALVALAWVVSSWRRAPAVAGRPSGAALLPEGRGRVGAAIALLAGFCLFLPWTGYPLVAFLFTGLLLRGLGAGWIAAVIVGLVSAAASYYLFSVLLGVPLPPGILFD
jgi:putative tricarboxylic transport membrane protein